MTRDVVAFSTYSFRCFLFLDRDHFFRALDNTINAREFLRLSDFDGVSCLPVLALAFREKKLLLQLRTQLFSRNQPQIPLLICDRRRTICKDQCLRCEGIFRRSSQDVSTIRIRIVLRRVNSHQSWNIDNSYWGLRTESDLKIFIVTMGSTW